jgi:hypothetical protein
MEDPTLLLNQRFPGILAQLRTKTDLIVIDGPSLLSGSDAMMLATMVDGVALVLDSRHDKLKLLLRAKEMLSSLTHTPSGAILNRMPRRRRNNYFVSAPSTDIPSEQSINVPSNTIPGSGNVSAYNWRGEKEAAYNSAASSANGIDPAQKIAVPTMPASVSMNGMIQQPYQSVNASSPNGTGNRYPPSPAANGAGNGYATPPAANGAGNGYPSSPAANGAGNGYPSSPAANGAANANKNPLNPMFMPRR